MTFEQIINVDRQRMLQAAGSAIEREITDYLTDVIEDGRVDVDEWDEGGRVWKSGKWEGSVELEAAKMWVDVVMYFRFSYKSGTDPYSGPWSYTDNVVAEVCLTGWTDRETDEPCDAPAYVDALEIADEIKWLLRN